MSNRPCRADADLKRMWQLLLPDTPFTACGTPENAAAAALGGGGGKARAEKTVDETADHNHPNGR